VLTPYHDDEYMLRIGRDLLDQQIIDVNGRKVVRVNDITFEHRAEARTDTLNVLEVDIGIRSILRRLLQGWVPPRWIRRLQQPIPPNSIRWEFANIVEADPQRRLRLNISHERLADIHPADLADIVEELSPAEREAIFESLDNETAAEALTEVDPRMQAQILESLEPEKAADIIEEMAPDEAADVLGDMETEASEEILEEMESSEKSEVRELLEYEEDTAGGMMNTEFVHLHENASVADALSALKGNEDLLDNLNTLFLTDDDGRPLGAVPLARLFLASGETMLRELAAESMIQVSVDEKQDRVTELFDKYNLMTLPVTDEDGKLAGVVTADDVISVLRQK
jgi:magnesium transporter